MELCAKAARSFRVLISPSWCQNMTTHTEETIASAMVLACLLIALFAILLAAPLLFLLTHMGAACCAIAGTF
jgi:hypothetical protein